MSTLQRCIECGAIISDDDDYDARTDNPDLCSLCNEDNNG